MKAFSFLLTLILAVGIATVLSIALSTRMRARLDALQMRA